MASAAKLSISIPRELERSVRKHVGSRGLSRFAADAFRRELERRRLGDYLDTLDEELGPVSGALLEEARRAWKKH